MKYGKVDIPVYSTSEVQAILSELGGKIGFPCFMAFIYGLIRVIRFHLSEWQGLTILIGATLSLMGTIAHSISIIKFKKDEKSWLGVFLSLSGFFPYLFGCFLVFYKGFWSFKYLLISFSFWKLISPAIWILLGYRIVSQFHLMTELGRSIDEGRIKVNE